MKEFEENKHPKAEEHTKEIVPTEHEEEQYDLDQNGEEGFCADPKEDQAHEAGACEQKEDPCGEASERKEAMEQDGFCSEEQKEATEKDVDVTEEEEPRQTIPSYSTSYVPPYYVPNFSVSHAPYEESGTAKRKKGGRTALIALLCAAALLLSAAIGCLAGAWSAGVYYAAMGKNTDERKDASLGLEKNNGSVVIHEEETDVEAAKSYTQVVEMVADSVVEITVVDGAGGGGVSVGAGSGVLIDQDQSTGYLVTNYHVAGATSQSIGVRLTDGAEYEATYVAGDEASDLAILSITKKGEERFTTATFGSSEKLSVGDRVVAIGNPLGTLGGTVTQGIISGKNLDLLVNGFVMNLLQTDAAVNPGNSGGGLFNMAGELIGVVNAKVAAEGIEGLAFAIPGDYVCTVVKEAIENGYVTGRPTLGVGVIYGVVGSGSSAKTGIAVQTSTVDAFQEGDLITEINGVAVSNETDYCKIMKNLKLGDTVTVKFSRLTVKGYNFMGIPVYDWTDMEATVTVTEYRPAGR